MRDSNRIYEILDALRQGWEKVPDWRFFQLVCNLQRFANPSEYQTDSFYIEDDVALKAIKEMFKLGGDDL